MSLQPPQKPSQEQLIRELNIDRGFALSPMGVLLPNQEVLSGEMVFEETMAQLLAASPAKQILIEQNLPPVVGMHHQKNSMPLRRRSALDDRCKGMSAGLDSWAKYAAEHYNLPEIPGYSQLNEAYRNDRKAIYQSKIPFVSRGQFGAVVADLVDYLGEDLPPDRESLFYLHHLLKLSDLAPLSVNGEEAGSFLANTEDRFLLVQSEDITQYLLKGIRSSSDRQTLLTITHILLSQVDLIVSDREVALEILENLQAKSLLSGDLAQLIFSMDPSLRNLFNHDDMLREAISGSSIEALLAPDSSIVLAAFNQVDLVTQAGTMYGNHGIEIEFVCSDLMARAGIGKIFRFISALPCKDGNENPLKFFSSDQGYYKSGVSELRSQDGGYHLSSASFHRFLKLIQILQIEPSFGAFLSNHLHVDGSIANANSVFSFRKTPFLRGSFESVVPTATQGFFSTAKAQAHYLFEAARHIDQSQVLVGLSIIDISIEIESIEDFYRECPQLVNSCIETTLDPLHPNTQKLAAAFLIFIARAYGDVDLIPAILRCHFSQLLPSLNPAVYTALARMVPVKPEERSEFRSEEGLYLDNDNRALIQELAALSPGMLLSVLKANCFNRFNWKLDVLCRYAEKNKDRFRQSEVEEWGEVNPALLLEAGCLRERKLKLTPYIFERIKRLASFYSYVTSAVHETNDLNLMLKKLAKPIEIEVALKEGINVFYLEKFSKLAFGEAIPYDKRILWHFSPYRYGDLMDSQVLARISGPIPIADLLHADAAAISLINAGKVKPPTLKELQELFPIEGKSLSREASHGSLYLFLAEQVGSVTAQRAIQRRIDPVAFVRAGLLDFERSRPEVLWKLSIKEVDILEGRRPISWRTVDLLHLNDSTIGHMIRT